MTFDLDAVGALNQGLLFRCRIVDQAAQDVVKIRLGQPSGSEKSGTPTQAAMVTLQPAQLARARYIDIRLSPQGSMAEVRLYGRDSTGVSAILPRGGTPNGADVGTADLSRGTITMEIHGATRLIMDVSMIPAVPTKRSAWNWDWVVGGPLRPDRPSADGCSAATGCA